MSRIADVLQKAREENTTRDRADPGEHTPRSLAQIRIPWSLGETANDTPTPPALEVTEARSAAEKPRQVLVPRRVEVVAPRPHVDDFIVGLVRNLFQVRASADKAVRRVLFTSVDDTPGSAELTPRVAEALAGQSNRSVCLADLDLDRPTLHQRFRLEGQRGFSDAVMERGPLRACTHAAPSISNLWLMPAGLPTLEVRPRLGDADTQWRLAELLGTFYYVIAYTAPIGLHADATVIGSLFDGVVLVVNANATKADVVRSAAQSLERAKVPLLGTVLNNSAA